MTSSPLTDALRAELRAALPILERADDLLGPRLGKVRSAIATADRRRRRYRIHLVERQLLPAISPATQQRLHDTLPDFVDDLIRSTFAQHQRRFMWFGWMAWFAGKPYREALTLMRVRLTRYVDRQRFGQLDAMRRELDRLDGERRALYDASRTLRALMRLIRQALRDGIDLDPQSWQQLRTLLAQLPPLQPPAVRRTRRQDDDDRAALFSFTTSSQGSSLWRDMGQGRDPDAFQGQFDGGGASGDWDNGKEGNGDTAGPESRSGSQANRGNAANDMAPVAAAVGAVAIATNDSLGLFS